MISVRKNFSATNWINFIHFGMEVPRYILQVMSLLCCSSCMFLLMVDQKQTPGIYGDQNEETDQCGFGYFGLVEKYQNILEGYCFDKKCTACEIKNSLLETTKLKLRGLCRYSSFDTTYTVQYSPDSMVSYVGLGRTVISYNFTLNIWTMRDVTNTAVTAVSQASFRSLAIGNIKWTINNDTKCSKGLDKT